MYEVKAGGSCLRLLLSLAIKHSCAVLKLTHCLDTLNNHLYPLRLKKESRHPQRGQAVNNRFLGRDLLGVIETVNQANCTSFKKQINVIPDCRNCCKINLDECSSREIYWIRKQTRAYRETLRWI